ncbi:olfactory receptor-like protein COR3 [Neolamprologus brichardi]|uniref:olfactory receptor-like protein COR3 n=1 Tax=Neolamprologus brichardi TaxID=32507 RepID=UPI0016439B13|nr:olfactory receptor-like protein COR3 [Neolamprologus brichardi]
MNAEMNITYITFGGHVEVEKYRYIYFVIMFMVYVLIICSNSTIVWVIIVQKSLHEPMYIFIAALLVNSILLSTVIYPKLLIDFLSEKQIILYHACLFQLFMFYVLSSSEFLLLSAMAYDRYVSICKPLQYPTIMRRTRVSIFLILSWFLPAIQIVVPVLRNSITPLCNFTLKGIFCNNSVNHLYCVTSKELSIYGMVVLFNVALFPMLFILFTYIKIIIVACQTVPGPCSDWCVDTLPRRDWFQLEDPPIKRRLECYSGRGPRFSSVVLWQPLAAVPLKSCGSGVGRGELPFLLITRFLLF